MGVGESHVVVAAVEWLELALEDVVGQRLAGGKARRAVGGDGGIADWRGDVNTVAVRAAFGERGLLVLDDFLRERDAALVRVNPPQPGVEGEHRRVGVGLIAKDRDLAAPEHLVGGGAEVAQQPRPHGVRAVDVVERARVGAAQVDDRDLVEVGGLVDPAAAVGVDQPGQVGGGPLRLDHVVDGEPAEVAVEVDELGRRQQPLGQPLEAVLDADVVEDAVAKPVRGRRPSALTM